MMSPVDDGFLWNEQLMKIEQQKDRDLCNKQTVDSCQQELGLLLDSTQDSIQDSMEQNKTWGDME